MNTNLPWGIQIPVDRQIEGWNAEEWLEHFDRSKQHLDTHSVSADVFQSTARIVQAGTYVSQTQKIVGLSNYLNPDNITDNVFYNREIVTQKKNSRFYSSSCMQLTI